MHGILRMELERGWRLQWCDYGVRGEAQRPDAGSDRVPFQAPEFDDGDWLPARVPGDVHLDLMRAGLIPDPLVGTNTDRVLWMEQKDWWYRLRFSLPRAWSVTPGQSLRLLFHGLDCFATVFLNGEEIARCCDMFIPLEVDVTRAVRYDRENLLAVRLAAPLFAPMEFPARAPTDWGHPRQLSRKAQMSFGWDIAPRLVTTGIWKPVELVRIDRARLLEPWFRTLELDPRAGSALLQAVLPVEVLPGAGEARVRLSVAGKEVGRTDLSTDPARQEARLQWRVDGVRCWWPRGAGEPYLYDYHLELMVDDVVVDERRGHLGIRRIELDRSPTADGGHACTFLVNGRKLFIRGWNWTPSDAIFARITPARRRELLRLAHDSNANMLRVWGGGIYEPRDFYEECDRLGLLVWQDFMFACSQYPNEAGFLDLVRAEARQVVRSLRSHPCIALWCGDNECDGSYPDLRAAQANRISRDVLQRVVAQLDPDTPYIPSSPDSPAGRLYNDPDDSDAHLWLHGEDFRHPYFACSRAKFISETGFLSLPEMAVVRAMGGSEELPWPPAGEAWDFHGADCIRSRRFRGLAILLRNIAACGLEPPRSLAEAIAVTQRLQAEAVGFWVERAAARDECGGILLWNLCDCWGQMSDAVIAWPLAPKPAYYAAREAFARAAARRP